MINTKIEDKTSKEFFEYLNNLGISSKSLKFYRSDLSHFTGWLLLKIRSFGASAERLVETIPFINNKLASEYKEYLVNNQVALKTVNRRLSTLRHLSRFFIETQILDFDFMQNLSNLDINAQNPHDLKPIIADFQKHLEDQNVSHNTIKNYLSDIKQFVSWLEKNSNQPLTVNH
jgi:site-specific recombinase XerD